jgi:hypothetical protein
MDFEMEKRIIDEYLQGKSSQSISELLGFSKPLILKILNSHGIVRKKERCKKLDIKKEGDLFYMLRPCRGCGEDVRINSKNRTILCRYFYNSTEKKSQCKKCSLKMS